jgi:hypothetical protein
LETTKGGQEMIRQMSRIFDNNTFKTSTPSAAASKLTDAQLRELIAKKAYEIYQRKGFTAGSDLANWLEAEKLIKKEHNIK